ncbi:MAG TPA: MBL fold metallo-hydrolase [Methanospirillum sp.]|uniref:MBL fold metallo-hydrolase n=1 Tax=Methanospirillum sp. TaxID=45200 RepID=UPI002D18BEAB|nr:MBL fold metallo-hydrolase [Methanospirillum sp.]HOJ96042.1 MBL fold metallo-hydrolase [Methanospirillum sp.]HOL40792.1 MBL fold metallo-hydrolase [Methanospirillum sp.]HPP77081.1 MBL fold metallo-hydrolase [Methanospirillum sp.]
MDIENLTRQSTIYTSNVWFCSCNDANEGGVLIDTGCDPGILEYLQEQKKRLGRNPVSQIILTHNHYDHARLLTEIKKEYGTTVYASSPYATGIDRILSDGDVIRCGIYHFEIIAIPGHTSDSICIYCPEEEILFSGDTPMMIWGTDNTYEQAFIRGFEELATKKFHTIYPGHGEIIATGVADLIRNSLVNLHKSRVIK